MYVSIHIATMPSYIDTCIYVYIYMYILNHTNIDYKILIYCTVGTSQAMPKKLTYWSKFGAIMPIEQTIDRKWQDLDDSFLYIYYQFKNLILKSGVIQKRKRMVPFNTEQIIGLTYKAEVERSSIDN